MPIFEFLCLKCKHRFEELIFKEREVRCPRCGGEVKKVPSKFSTAGSESQSSVCSSCTATSCDTCGSGGS